MKANELRLGNWIYDLIKGEPIPTQVDADHIRGLFFNAKIPTHRAEPIPLTEEWLIKFGFIGLGHYTLGHMEIGTMDDDFVKNQFTTKYKGVFINKIQHVHQLQNLYFALTGEELTIKETA